MNFTATHAIVFHCDTCAERFVGADPNEDKETEVWMTKHAKWHQSTPTRPPKDLVLP